MTRAARVLLHNRPHETTTRFRPPSPAAGPASWGGFTPARVSGILVLFAGLLGAIFGILLGSVLAGVLP